MYLGQQQDHAGSPGKEFHTDGPATEKACRAVVLSRQRGTTRSRWQVDQSCAVMRRWRPDDRNLSGTVELGQHLSDAPVP